ncbi:MAG: lipopolysaccharide biosynthesis protein [Bacteroidota bacterium]|jgi:O-antigen/teichoic acid export membrane protein|nr:oligosaccharide flippase family protein [Cytophagales bacterium]
MWKSPFQFVDQVLHGVKSKGSFAQNFAITFSGNMIAQLIGFLMTPIIARLYGPSMYGVFALLMSVVTNLAPVSTLQFPAGFVAAQDDSEFAKLLRVTWITLITFTVLLACILAVASEPILRFFNISDLSYYLVWIPVYVLVMGVDYIFAGWNIRVKQFKRGASAKIVSLLTSKATAIAWAIFLTPSALGLIASNFLTYPIESISKLSREVRTAFFQFSKFSRQELGVVVTKYKSYPLFVTPGVFVANISNFLPIFYISYAFDRSMVGNYALANGLVSVPLWLVIHSSVTVFTQKAAETLQQARSEVAPISLTLYRKLFLVFTPLMFLAALASKFIFLVVFGDLWQQAGEFSSYLCVAALVHIVYSPLSVLFRLTDNEHINLSLNIFSLLLKGLGLWLGAKFGGVHTSIIGFGLASIVSGYSSLFILFGMLKANRLVLVRDFFIVCLIGIFIVWFHTLI